MIRSRLLFVALALSLIACGEVKATAVDAAQIIDAPSIDALTVDAPTDAAGMVTLSIVRGGAGTGRVTSSPTGLDCGATCSGSFPVGTLVTLTAAPGIGSNFTGWGGACAGSLTTCSLTLNANTAVNADFAPTLRTVTLVIGGNGTGTVASMPTGLNCPGVCTVSVPDGTSFMLNATATGASTFAGWSGAGCSGTGACAFTVTSDLTINASFALNFSLIVTKIGTGTGTVTSSPAGITCGADCTETYPANTMVTLSAAPAADSVFAGWSGGCTGTGACVVTISAAVMVTATFNLQQFTLTATQTGNGIGNVSSTPFGINCPSDCTESYGSGTMVTLTPTAGTGSTFAGWSGACTGTGACTVAMTAARSVTFTFTLDSYNLTAARAGTGTGTVTSSPSGISCGLDCTEAYLYNTLVILTATPAVGSTFTGWSGDCTGASCSVTMTQARSVTATFTLNSYTLTATRAGSGVGTVTSSPAGINCGADCTEVYLNNTSVTLTATPNATSTFAGWSGDCTGLGACTVTMTQARSVTATFTATVTAPNYMFVTSTVATGNLGGLVGADAFCQARANAASLPGTYRAWLSSPSVNAINRFGTASGWIRPDGKPFAQTAANIGAGLISTPPRINELGVDVLEVTAMTGTTLGGIYDTNSTDCSGWTGTVGSTRGGPTSASSAMFTFYSGATCASGGRLYCFGVDRAATVTAPSPPPNRRAFMRLWGPGGGIAAADAACQSDATANGLAGTYKALLATTTGSALSRFDLTGRPWYRVDNVAVLPSASAWPSATFFDSGTNLTANGSMTYHNYVNWAGASNLTTAGTIASTCSNWTVTTATAQYGIAGTTRLSLFFGTGNQMCDFAGGAITCLQE